MIFGGFVKKKKNLNLFRVQNSVFLIDAFFERVSVFGFHKMLFSVAFRTKLVSAVVSCKMESKLFRD